MRERDRKARSACVFLIITALISASSGAVMCSGNYKIRGGDTVWDIAHKQHVSVKAILHANGLKETSTLPLGGSLVIPGKNGKKPHQTAKKATRVCRPVAAAAQTRSDGVYLRSGPGTGQKAVAKLRAGTPVRVIGVCGSWRKVVISGGVKGFVYRPLLCTGPMPSMKSPASQASAACAAPGTTPNATLIRTALACRGARYRRGGTSRGGFDCSGFTRYIFSKYGISLPHSSVAQAGVGSPVSRGGLRAGDLVFFRTYRRGISHVGIYVGDGRFVHASTPRGGVRVDSLGLSYYTTRYRGARRVR